MKRLFSKSEILVARRLKHFKAVFAVVSGTLLTLLIGCTEPQITMTTLDDLASSTNIRTEGMLTIKSIPPIPQQIKDDIAKYQNARSATLVGWFNDGILIETRFSNTSQLHHVRSPLGMREQVTFSAEPFGGGIIPTGDAQDGLIYTRDVGGSENYQMFWLDWESRNSRLLSDGHSRYTGISLSPSNAKFGYATTEKNGMDWDIHLQSMDGTRDILQEGEGIGWRIANWHPDETKLLVTKYVSIAESYLYEFDLETKERTQLLTDHGKFSISSPFYNDNGSAIYFASDLDSEFIHLYQLDLQTNTVVDLMPELKWNLEGARLSTDRSKLAYTVNEDGYSTLSLVELNTFEPLPLPTIPQGDVGSMRFNHDGSKLAFSLVTPTQPSDVYEIDLDSQELVRWTHSELGEIRQEDLVQPEQFSYTSFDELNIPAFMYKPKGTGPHPVFVHIHGGPESQSRPRFSSLFQYLQNELGVAVVVPNVRGSDGYGKTYVGLDNGYQREDSVKDIGALLDWIAEQPDLDESKVVVYGGSYGGYMVLASMVHYSDRLRGGIESVGISNFVTFLENTQDYRRDLRRAEYGDERDPDMRAFLESIAPLNQVARITKPMLIAQGLNDPRVPASESEQIVAKLEQSEVPVWYVIAANEGHGFRKKPNRDYFNQALALFLHTHLLN